MSSKKPVFTPKVTKISVPILSNVVPGLSSLTAAVNDPAKTVSVPVSDAAGNASAIAVSSMPAKKRPLHGTASSVSQTADTGKSPRDSAAQSTSSDSSYESDMDLVVFEKSGKKRGAASSSAGTAKKKISSESAPVIIVPSSSSAGASSSTSLLDKYDKLSKPDLPTSTKSVPTVKSGSSSSATKAAGTSNQAPKEKRTRVRKPKPTHEIFPPSMPVPDDIIKMTKYFRKTPEGVVGITFANVENRPVVETIDRALYPETHNNNGSLPHHIQTGDVVISVNNLDSRFVGYDRVMSELVLKSTGSGGAGGGGDDRASIKNSVTDTMAVVVLARPVYKQ